MPAPTQAEPTQAEFDFALCEAVAESGQIARDALTRFAEEEALARRLPPGRLVALLGEYGWKSDYHIGVSQVWEMLTRNVYMPRLASGEVLAECIREGVGDGSFGYADGLGPGDGTYRGLRWRGQPGGMPAGSPMGGLLIHPDMAAEEAGKHGGVQAGGGGAAGDGDGPPAGVREDGGPSATGLRGHSLIVANARMSGDIKTGSISDLLEAVVGSIRDDGGAVDVSITVRGSKDGVFSEHAVRAVRENAGRFDVDVDFEGGDGA